MKMSPKFGIRLSAVAALAVTATLALGACGSPAPAPDEPTESILSGGVTIDAPSGPGSGYDQTARALEQALSAEGLAGSVQVRNTEGAGGTIALANFVDKTGTDEIMVAGFSLIGATITNASPNKLGDLTPIARLIGEYEVIVVPAESPYENLKDFLTALENDPGANPIAIGNQGGLDHIWGATLADAAGIDPTTVSFVTFSGGGEVTIALLGNQVAAGISGYGEFADQIDAGELRVLAVSSEEPLDFAPDAPTVAEEGYPEAVIFNWRGVLAPPGISDEDRAALDAVFADLAESDAWKEALETNGWSDVYQNSADFEAFLDEQQSQIEKTLSDLGLV